MGVSVSGVIAHPARVVVAKARRGSIGFVGARFDGPSGRWSEDGAIAAAMSSGVRQARAEQRKHEADDAVMAQAIEGAAQAGTHRSPRAWRTQGGLPEGRTTAAIARLVAPGGRFVLRPGPRSNGDVVYPASAVPPVAPIDPTSIAVRGGYLVGDRTDRTN